MERQASMPSLFRIGFYFFLILSLFIAFSITMIYLSSFLIRNQFEMKPPITGQSSSEFSYPITNHNGTLNVFYNFTSNSFAQNDYVAVNITLEVPDSGFLEDIAFYPVKVQIKDAVDDSYLYKDYPKPFEMELYNLNNHTIESGNGTYDVVSRYYSARSLVVFQSVGSQTLNLKLYAVFLPESRKIIDDIFRDSPNDEYEYMQKWQPFSTSITIPNLNIESEKVAQLGLDQKSLENQNLIIALVVMFLASFDVAIALYGVDRDNRQRASRPNNEQPQSYIGEDI